MVETMQVTMVSETLVRKGFASALRELRSATGLSQESFALETKLDRTFVSGLERAKHTPTLFTLYRLLPTLNVTLLQLASAIDRHVRRARTARLPR